MYAGGDTGCTWDRVEGFGGQSVSGRSDGLCRAPWLRVESPCLAGQRPRGVDRGAQERGGGGRRFVIAVAWLGSDESDRSLRSRPGAAGLSTHQYALDQRFFLADPLRYIGDDLLRAALRLPAAEVR